jgi:hypothetical protein
MCSAPSLHVPASADAPASAEQALPQHDKLINWYQEARAATRSAIKAAQTGGGTGGAAKAGPEAGGCREGRQQWTARLGPFCGVHLQWFRDVGRVSSN